MGAIARTFNRAATLLPERKINVGAMIPSWEDGKPQYPRHWHNYYRFALEGYSRNEIYFAGVEELATSAAEPRLIGKVKTAKGTEDVKDHPVLDLFEKPNPFMSRFQLIASLIMYRAVAGNAYLVKERSAAGKVVELWPLRPDRMFVIPDVKKHIRGWEYRLEGYEPFQLLAEDVIQFKTRNPLDDYYGLPPLAVCAERLDTDALMRSFTMSFFRNAAVPAGLLNIKKQVTAAERQIIRDKFRGELGGPQNWHQLAVFDNGQEATYTPMGLPLGQAGIVLPDLDSISEVRILMVLGVPLELVGARTGMVHGNRSTTKEARATFWDETLVPLYAEMASDLTLGMDGEYDDLDYLDFDLSTVKALQEDDDAKHTRLRADLAAGGISVQEFRAEIGRDPDFDSDAILMIQETLVPQRADQAINAPVPRPLPAPPVPDAPTPNGNGNGHKPVDMAALKRLASGRS